jgi:hypothetical protein
MYPIDNNDYLGVMIDKGVRVVETSCHSASKDVDEGVGRISGH